MIWTDIVIVLLMFGGAYVGAQRGIVLMTLELTGFLLAWVTALLVYRPLGQVLRGPLGITMALANVAAFVVIIGAVQLGVALVIRFVVVPHLAAKVAHGQLSRVLGAALNMVKTALLIMVGLIVFAGLPLAAATKKPITEAVLAQPLLTIGSQLQQLLGGGLGRDINDTFTLLTAPAEPQDTRRIILGFTATGLVDQAAEVQMLQLVNHERTSRGLPALIINTGARAVARSYSQKMLADGIFSHIDNAGHTPFDRLRTGGVTFGLAGENLALAPTLLLAHQGLMNSPGHRANILRPSYRTVGIGVIDAGIRGLMVVQDFTD